MQRHPKQGKKQKKLTSFITRECFKATISYIVFPLCFIGHYAKEWGERNFSVSSLIVNGENWMKTKFQIQHSNAPFALETLWMLLKHPRDLVFSCRYRRQEIENKKRWVFSNNFKLQALTYGWHHGEFFHLMKLP